MALKSLHSPLHWLPRLLVMALVLAAGMLTACQPKVEPTLPPAIQVAAQAASNTSVPPSATLAPTEQPSATITPTTQAIQRQATTLTILHTNDVVGESNPCG